MTTTTYASHLDFSALDDRKTLDYGKCRVYIGHETTAAPSLLFIAGGYHGAWCFSHYLDYFEHAGIGCYAIDLPGHGALADSLSPNQDMAELATSLIEACRALARPLVLVGHSIGALPALMAAKQLDPAGVILLAPSPPGNLPGALPLRSIAVGAFKRPPCADEVRDRFLGSQVKDVTPVTERLGPESPVVLNDRYRLRISVDPTRITCPGICFEAQLDDHDRHPPGQDQNIARFFGFDYRLLPDQPHCMMYGPRWAQSALAIHTWCHLTFPSNGTAAPSDMGTHPIAPHNNRDKTQQ